jgi:hypothetical protein
MKIFRSLVTGAVAGSEAVVGVEEIKEEEAGAST